MDPLFHVLVQNSSDAIVMLNATGGILFASERLPGSSGTHSKSGWGTARSS
jgi:hypothetical protein